jgi:hypothetical protein
MYSYPKNPPIPLTAAQHKAVPRMLLLPEAAVLLRKRAPARRGRAGAAGAGPRPPRCDLYNHTKYTRRSRPRIGPGGAPTRSPMNAWG